MLERNPYSPPTALVEDVSASADAKTPWGRAAAFYWAFTWRVALIGFGMFLPLGIIYSIVKFVVDVSPPLDALIRLSAILVFFAFGACLAILWAAESSFSGYLLRTFDTNGAVGPRRPSSPNGISPRQAGRLFASHLWRYLLAVIPINVALIWFLVGRSALTAHDWTTVLKVQSINLSIGFVVGIWAMREALSVVYPAFRFQWIAAGSRSDSTGAETQMLPGA